MSPTTLPVPCHSHLTFSTLTNQKRRNFSLLTTLPSTVDPCCDALLAADELAAIALGADPGFMTVSSAETYVGRVVVEDIGVRAVVKDGAAVEGEKKKNEEGKGEVEPGNAKRTGYVQTWNRDATGWQMVDAQGFVGEQAGGGQREGQMPQTAVVAVLVGACFRHGWKVSVVVEEMCG